MHSEKSCETILNKMNDSTDPVNGREWPRTSAAFIFIEKNFRLFPPVYDWGSDYRVSRGHGMVDGMKQSDLMVNNG